MSDDPKPAQCIEPLDRDLFNSEYEGSIIRPRRDEYTKETTVDSLPPVCRTEVMEADTLYRQALLCLLSEYVDLTAAQVAVVNQVFHRRPRSVTFSEWVLTLLDNWSGLRNEVGDSDDVDRVIKAIDLLRDRILHLCSLDLASAGYRELVDDKYFPLMLPITAAKFLMTTRPTEHVMLTRAIIRWAQGLPATTREQGIDPYLVTAPMDPVAYSRVEYLVRRMQRTYFSGLTSYECHILINEEA